MFYALANQIYGTLPFLMLFQIGFLYTGLLSILQQFAGDDVLEPKPEVASSNRLASVRSHGSTVKRATLRHP